MGVIEPADAPVCGQRWGEKTCIVTPPGHAGQHVAEVRHDDGTVTVSRWGGETRYDR